MANTFVFDSLGASPHKLRANLDKLAKHDRAFKRARQINNELNGNGSKDKALATIKLAKKLRNHKYPKKLLFALSMYRQADKLADERKTVSGNHLYTLGADYQSIIKEMKGDIANVIIGAKSDIKHKIRVYAKKNKLWGKFDKKYGYDEKWGHIEKALLKKFPKHPKEVKQVVADRHKTREKQIAARPINKIIKVAKIVAKVALPIAKMIPGVGDAIKVAENAVKKIPGVKEALDLADKVKNTVKEAKAIGDTVKLDKLKDLGKNAKVMEALDIDKVVKGKIANTVKKVNILKSANIVNMAEKIAPDQVKVAMKLVKAAQEMDPAALKQIQSIQKLADSGLMEAQKAIQAMRVAINVQNTAKQQTLSQYRMWQYW